MSTTIQAYDDFADIFATDSLKWTPVSLLDEFSTLLKHGSKILDIGCGSGRDTNELALRGFLATGLDASQNLLTNARSRYPAIDFVHGDIRHLPFPDNSFSGIWCHAVILHLETINDVEKSLKEMYRVLDASGVVHLYTKAYVSGPSTEEVISTFFDKPRFFRYFKLDELVKLVEKNNFKLIKSEQIDESSVRPNGRPGVFWIHLLAQKP